MTLFWPILILSSYAFVLLMHLGNVKPGWLDELLVEVCCLCAFVRHTPNAHPFYGSGLQNCHSCCEIR